MSHLGERLTALVDGELGHYERDRVLAHMAFCAQCRAEADALRRLKDQLRSAPEAAVSSAFLARLSALGEPEGTMPSQSRPLPGDTPPPTPDRRSTGRPDRRTPASDRPWGQDDRPWGRVAAVRVQPPRPRNLVVGAAALAMLGVGAVPFATRVEPERLAQVAPALERFAVQHTLTWGDTPTTGPATPGERRVGP